MLMYNGNQYILLGFLYIVLGGEAFNLDFGIWHDDDIYTKPVHTTHYEPVVEVYESPEEPTHKYPTQEPYVDPVTPVKIATVQVQEKVEHLVHIPQEVPFDLRKIKFMSATETVTITVNSLYRSTVVITPTVYKTDTMVVQTNTVVTGNVISYAETTVTETKIYVHTITKPQILYKTVSTPVIMYLTVEAQTTETIWQPYTLTTTNRKVHTIWTTTTVELANENSIWIPVVEVETMTTTIPYHVTRTDWITMTDTTTVCKEW